MLVWVNGERLDRPVKIWFAGLRVRGWRWGKHGAGTDGGMMGLLERCEILTGFLRSVVRWYGERTEKVHPRFTGVGRAGGGGAERCEPATAVQQIGVAWFVKPPFGSQGEPQTDEGCNHRTMRKSGLRRAATAPKGRRWSGGRARPMVGQRGREEGDSCAGDDEDDEAAGHRGPSSTRLHEGVLRQKAPSMPCAALPCAAAPAVLCSAAQCRGGTPPWAPSFVGQDSGSTSSKRGRRCPRALPG